MVVVFEYVARCETGVDGDDGVETVELVRHGCGVDGGVGPDDGGGEVGVGARGGEELETHANFVRDGISGEKIGMQVEGRGAYQA